MKYFVGIIVFTLVCYVVSGKYYNEVNVYTDPSQQEYKKKLNRDRLDSKYLIFRKYFPDEEVDIIIPAAERNGIIQGENLFIIFAIRQAENGRDELAFGIMNEQANTFDKQAGWAAATIMKNRERWKGNTDFITFLGSRYCPTNTEVWVKNVKYWYHKLHNEYEEHRRLGTAP